jgi:hypothetical protein
VGTKLIHYKIYPALISQYKMQFLIEMIEIIKGTSYSFKLIMQDALIPQINYAKTKWSNLKIFG